MTATMSPSLDTSIVSPTSPSPISSPSANPNHPSLHPLITSPPARRTTLERPKSHASKSRLSQYSQHSMPSRSRPPSHIFPIFHSSLPYTLVRDFAYPTTQSMHYGPPPEPSRPPSGLSTPASESQKWLSDPPVEWEKGGWESWSANEPTEISRGEQLAPIQFLNERDREGPPWSEDEDIQSPVVSSSRHRKSKSGAGYNSRGRSRKEGGDRSGSNQENYDHDRELFSRAGGNSRERYYAGQAAENASGDFVTYPPSHNRLSQLAPPYNVPGQRDSHFAGVLPSRSFLEKNGHGLGSDDEMSSEASSPDLRRDNESRYSRDYQFTIASPDEEMHGKAVALFNFVSESENELPLVEGQVVWVSYRQAEGWLVAEDPRTQERGLVPEEYVRLLRDIQGGLNSLTGELTSPGPDSGTPTQAEHAHSFGHATTSSSGSNGYQQPVVSTFSTSSKDLHPYPQHLLDKQAGQAPPQVVHNHGQRGGSQANTPTISSSVEGRSSSRDIVARKADGTTIPGAKLETTPISPASETSDD